MSSEIFAAPDSDENRRVLLHLTGKSAHSDVADELLKAIKPLGDVQVFCPDYSQYLYLAGSTHGIIFIFAVGMKTLCFRLPADMKARALETGAENYPEAGPEWVAFQLFRYDWPKFDLEFWARKAYAAAREHRARAGKGNAEK